MGRSDGADPCCKVGVAAERFGLADLDGWLRRRWTAETDRASVRELTDEVNARIVRAAIAARGGRVLDGEAENYRRLLTDDGVSGGDRTEARASLRERGVDPDELEAAFVSHQTVYRHLSGCLGADPGTDASADDRSGDRVRDEIDRVRALRRRTEAVAASTVDRLDREGAVDIEEVDVLVDVTVSCRACGRQFPLAESLAGASCDCGGSP